MRNKCLVAILLLFTYVASSAAPAKTQRPRMTADEQRLFFSEQNFPGCLEQTEGSQVAARARELLRKFAPTTYRAPAPQKAKSTR